MFSFGLTFIRVYQGIARSWASPIFRSTLMLAILVLLSGTLFYRTVEGWSWVDSLYFSVMTAATIGFGDLTPTTPISKIFTIFYAISSVGVFVALVTQIASALIHPPRIGHGKAKTEADFSTREADVSEKNNPE